MVQDHHSPMMKKPSMVDFITMDLLPNRYSNRMDHVLSMFFTSNEKTAYIEGPIDCGDKGWYCRIYQQEGWPNVNLRGDYNFGLCNSTENFDDAGADKDGHCHGSSRDNTYYWWMRDHWHRGYNGRLRCCCGWESGSSSAPLTIGRVANRRDYLVP